MKLEKLIENQPFLNTISIIPGGSKGMGKETAKLISQMGGSVCLIARGQDALKTTAQECKELKVSNSQFVEIIQADTTDMDSLKPQLVEFVEKYGTPDYLINCVGYAYPQYIEKLSLDDFKQNMNVNYFGQLIPILILLPYFIKAKRGHIANISSMAGYLGIMGYATYTPTKFAIVGLSETLRNELLPYNIKISILYPPDTDTPGFEKENKTKPPECALISEGGKLLSAQEVASTFVKGILKEKFHIHPGESKLISFIKRLFPGLVYRVIDHDYKKARKKLGKK